MPLDFLNDVFLQNFPLEAFERTFQAFAILNVNFSQMELNLPPEVRQTVKTLVAVR